jgi:hypothetical protein
VEREPLLFVQAPGGRIYLDREGIGFRLWGEDVPAVEVVGIAAGPFRPGRRVGGRRIAVVLDACARARREHLAPRRITLSPVGEIDMLLASGATLRLGEANRLTEKLSTARQALDGLGDPGPIEYLDVSCPDAVVWKPADGSPRVGTRTGGG